MAEQDREEGATASPARPVLSGAGGEKDAEATIAPLPQGNEGLQPRRVFEHMRRHIDIANNRLAILLYAARNGNTGVEVQDPDEPSPRDVDWLLHRYRWEYGMLLDELDCLALWREKIMKSVRRSSASR